MSVSNRGILEDIIMQEIQSLYSQRYQMPRNQLPRGSECLTYTLTTLKQYRADKFREEVRVTPYTFDRIVSEIQDNPVFCNNLNNAQLAVETQLAVFLWRLGRNGNGATLQSAANWAGVSKGTVGDCTRRVMTAILSPDFRRKAVHFPTAEEKRKAKSLARWQGGRS
jgi:hypothetical protein